MRTKTLCAITGALCLVFAACSKLPEMTLEEIQLHSQNLNESLFQKTISKPWTGGEYKENVHFIMGIDDDVAMGFENEKQCGILSEFSMTKYPGRKWYDDFNFVKWFNN